MTSQKTPADRILKQFGVERVAGWAKRHRTRVHAWTWPAAKGGTGGVIPHRVRGLIIDGAKRELGVDLSHADFEPRDDEVYLTEVAA